MWGRAIIWQTQPARSLWRQGGPGAVSKEKESPTWPPDSFELSLGFKNAELTFRFLQWLLSMVGQVVYCTRVSIHPGEQQLKSSLHLAYQGTLVGVGAAFT